jgi:hypothetical protein
MTTVAARRRLSVNDVVRALERAGVPIRRAGRGWVSHCPAHHDEHMSLSFAEGEDGSALIFCFAGCQTVAVVKALGATGTARPLSSAEVERRRAAAEADRLAREARARELHARSLKHPDRIAALTCIARALKWGVDTLFEYDVGWDGNRVCFPSVLDDVVVGVSMYAAPGTRARAEDRPKVIAYGRRALWPQPTADVEILVEGAPACATLLAADFAATGLPSAAARRVDAQQLAAAGVRRVLVLADADEVGRKAARTAVLVLRELGIRAKAIDISPLMDDGFPSLTVEAGSDLKRG